MKIAYFGAKGLPAKGGTERVLEAIVSRCSEHHEVSVYCDDRYTPAGYRLDRVRLIRIPHPQGKHIGPLSLFLLSALHALFFGDYDIVHLHGVESSFLLPLLKIRYPAMATSHGSPVRDRRAKWGTIAARLMGWMEYPYLFLADCATSVSDIDADYYQKRYNRRPIYVPNGVSAMPIMGSGEEAAALAQFKKAPKSYVMFAAARIDPTKGCHLAVEAFTKLQCQATLLVVGDLNQVREYGDKLRGIRNPKVEFLPLISDKRQFLVLVRNCRLFVFPSLAEGMSMVLLEVASLGVPLICSDIPENCAVLGERAVYFRSGDADDLREKMGWALANPDAMEKTALRAQEWVKENYSWDSVVERYDTLYKSLFLRKRQRQSDLLPKTPIVTN